jgi:hypothetical protein
MIFEAQPRGGGLLPGRMSPVIGRLNLSLQHKPRFGPDHGVLGSIKASSPFLLTKYGRSRLQLTLGIRLAFQFITESNRRNRENLCIMSFGFSIGDILLVSQLAYKLYSSVTSGRRSAARDLKELGDVLFGLRCALDHLSKAAKDISEAASNKQDANAVDMRRKLDTMINSCGATLQELDTVTSKYREAANQGESDVVDHTADVTATGPSTNPNKKRSISQFKQSVRVNWMKIRWDVERNSLSEYRVKLQAHTDAINIVLNTFLWYVRSHAAAFLRGIN